MEKKILDYKPEEGDQFSLNSTELDDHLEAMETFDELFPPTAKGQLHGEGGIVFEASSYEKMQRE